MNNVPIMQRRETAQGIFQNAFHKREGQVFLSQA